jgi:hypothetical protein
MNKKILSIVLLIVSLGVLTLAVTACGSPDVGGIGDGARYGRGAAQPQSEIQTGAQVETAQDFGNASPLVENDVRQIVDTARSGNSRGKGSSNGGNIGRMSNGSYGTLSEVEADALQRAIEEEYGAQALYESVVAAFGEVEPFVMIAKSEAQHAAALIRLAEKYGVAIPEYPDVNELPVFDSIEAACQAGVDAEIADAALYDELMSLTDRPDLLRVFANLQRASLENHLPAFQVCE